MKRFLGSSCISLFCRASDDGRKKATRWTTSRSVPSRTTSGFRIRARPEIFSDLADAPHLESRRMFRSEAEMAYDFKRDYTSTFSDGLTTTNVTSRLRTLHGFFGPKFQTGSGPVRLVVTGKVGFDNFNVTNANAPTGFTNSVGLGTGATYFAFIRLEASKHLPDRSGFVWKLATIFSSMEARTTTCA